MLLISSPSGEPIIKVADFGLAFKVEEGKTPQKAGTLDYLAPELLASDDYSQGVDMWALGVITYIL